MIEITIMPQKVNLLKLVNMIEKKVLILTTINIVTDKLQPLLQ